MSDWRYHKVTRETAEIYEIPGREVTYFLAAGAELEFLVADSDLIGPRDDEE